MGELKIPAVCRLKTDRHIIKKIPDCVTTAGDFSYIGTVLL